MNKVCLCIQLHLPAILRQYRFFEVNRDDYYYDDCVTDSQVDQFYKDIFVPFFDLVTKLNTQAKSKIKLGISVSGITLKLFKKYRPEALVTLDTLHQNGLIEFLSVSWSNSMVAFNDCSLLKEQLLLHDQFIQHFFGTTPTVFMAGRNKLSAQSLSVIGEVGKKAVVSFGTEPDKDWDHNTTAGCPEMWFADQKLSRSVQKQELALLSEKNKSRPEKLLKQIREYAQSTPVFIEYNLAQLGEPFLLNRSYFWQTLLTELGADLQAGFVLPSEFVGLSRTPSGNGYAEKRVSEKKDKNLWLKNDLQKEAFSKLVLLNEMVKVCDCETLARDWEYLQDKDYLFYMNDRFFEDEFAAQHFNPYQSPYLAFINYMNILSDLENRLLNRIRKNELEQHQLNSINIPSN